MVTNTYYSSTFDHLCKEGYTPCLPLSVRKILVTQEKQAKYTLDVTNDKESTLFDVDGVIIKDGDKCDKLILVCLCKKPIEQWAEIFVELKGTDIPHAIKQLKETISNQVFKHTSNTIIKACIVAHSFPSHKSDPLMEKAKIEFKKKFYCELKGFKSGQRDSI